jgi:murein DD-endopeptidase MepM/ murein hydrolase activator NlpD
MVYYTLSDSGWSRRPRRLIAQAAIAVVGTLALTSVVHADHSGSEADQAAREIQEVRDQAGRSAQAMFDAESELDVLAVEVNETEQRLSDLEAEAAEMRAVLETAAIRRFVGGGGQHEIGVFDVGTMSDLQIEEVLGSIAQGTGAVAVDDLDALLDQVETVRNELDHQRSDTESALERFEALKADAEDRVVQMVELEKTRQADAQVQHALERQRQERLEREAAAAAAAATAAAATAAQQPSRAGSGAASAGAGGGGSSSAAGSSSSSPAASAPRATGAAPAPAAPTPAPAPPPSTGSGMACPVGGPSAFFNSWGAPRSGGRSHQGVDMMAPRGTPLVASESGFASFSTNRLGGKVIWLSGGSGTRYYYAHLNGWAGSSRSVSRGEVIGYVGATGNTSANHLHFEVQPNGRSVNPYPYVVRAGC